VGEEGGGCSSNHLGIRSLLGSFFNGTYVKESRLLSSAVLMSYLEQFCSVLLFVRIMMGDLI